MTSKVAPVSPILCISSVMIFLVSAEAQPRKYSLQELIDKALSLNAEIGAAQWRLERAVARQRQARGARILPRLRLESENGLVPEARGDVFNPPADTTGIRPLGPFNRTELEFVQPLYAFGKFSSLMRAVEAGISVEEAALKEKRLEIALGTKSYFYGVLLAQDLRQLAAELHRELTGKQKELAGDPAIPLSSHYKVKLALLELSRQEREAAGQLELARAALAWNVGLTQGEPLQLDAEWLEPVKAEVPPLEILIDRALSVRPDWQGLQAGIRAKKSLRDAARSAYYPQIFLAGGLRYAVAPHRTDQRNPFVKDGFNYFNGGVFIGLRQSFEWGLLGGQLAQARAEYQELLARKRGVSQAIRLDVKRAYGDFQKAHDALSTELGKRKLTRQWLRLAKEEYELDPGELKELISAFEAWAQTEQDYFRAIYDHNLSLARLEKVSGGLPLSNDQ